MRLKNTNTANVRERPTRGFIEVIDGRDRVHYVRKGWSLKPCGGEAHSPEVAGRIDNCARCAPLWGLVATREET